MIPYDFPFISDKIAKQHDGVIRTRMKGTIE